MHALCINYTAGAESRRIPPGTLLHSLTLTHSDVQPTSSCYTFGVTAYVVRFHSNNVKWSCIAVLFFSFCHCKLFIATGATV